MVALAVDEMGARIDELERSIGDLMEQAGVEHEPEDDAAAGAAAHGARK